MRIWYLNDQSAKYNIFVDAFWNIHPNFELPSRHTSGA